MLQSATVTVSNTGVRSTLARVKMVILFDKESVNFH